MHANILCYIMFKIQRLNKKVFPWVLPDGKKFFYFSMVVVTHWIFFGKNWYQIKSSFFLLWIKQSDITADYSQDRRIREPQSESAVILYMCIISHLLIKNNIKLFFFNTILPKLWPLNRISLHFPGSPQMLAIFCSSCQKSWPPNQKLQWGIF